MGDDVAAGDEHPVLTGMKARLEAERAEATRAERDIRDANTRYARATTNAGVAYLAGADGVSESAVLEWYRCFSTLAATPAEALSWVGVESEWGGDQ